MCPQAMQGACMNGDRCNFAHHKSELRVTAATLKTSLCFSYMNGQCRNGDKCRFAHGEHELRPKLTNLSFVGFKKELMSFFRYSFLLGRCSNDLIQWESNQGQEEVVS